MFRVPILGLDNKKCQQHLACLYYDESAVSIYLYKSHVDRQKKKKFHCQITFHTALCHISITLIPPFCHYITIALPFNHYHSPVIHCLGHIQQRATTRHPHLRPHPRRPRRNQAALARYPENLLHHLDLPRQKYRHYN